MTHADFAAALLDPGRAAPAGLRTWNGSDPAARFAVHRNNVVVSLVQALADGFPVVQRLVGETFFAAMAAVHVRAEPPRSPVLAEYGDGFADWIAAFEPAAALPYLPDLARLERARVRAYHAEDAPCIDPTELAAWLRDADGLDRLRLALHPSATVVSSPWAVVSLWAAHQHEDDDAVARVSLHDAEAALVVRPGDEVLVLPLERPAAQFIRALGSGEPLGAALAAAGASFDLATTLSLLIRHGVITHLQP